MKFPSAPIPNLLSLTAVFYGFMLAIAALLIYLFSIEWQSWLYFNPLAALWSVFIGGLSAYLLIKLEAHIGFVNTRLGSDFLVLMKLIGKQPISTLLLISMAAGFCEEVLFRAVLQGLGIEYLGVITGIISVAILFGLLHAVSLSYFLYATFIGLILGLIYHLTKDLISLMILHAVFDFVAFYIGLYVYRLNDLSEENV